MKINTDKHSITQGQLTQRVHYDPLTGKMTRLTRVRGRKGKLYPCDTEITSKNNRGYCWLKIFGHIYLVHRLVFLYMTGSHPNGEVDHINGDRTDNRWGNLRDCDSFSQSRNQGVRSDNTSGVRGVNYSKRAGKWVVRISQSGERFNLGNYSSFEEAVSVRKNAEGLLGYHPNHGKRESWRK